MSRRDPSNKLEIHIAVPGAEDLLITYFGSLSIQDLVGLSVPVIWLKYSLCRWVQNELNLFSCLCQSFVSDFPWGREQVSSHTIQGTRTDTNKQTQFCSSLMNQFYWSCL